MCAGGDVFQAVARRANNNAVEGRGDRFDDLTLPHCSDIFSTQVQTSGSDEGGGLASHWE